MTTSIPFHPELVLGNLVEEDVLTAVKQVAVAQKPIDDAEEALNALIQAKLSLNMTIQELTSMGIDPKEVLEACKDVDKDITDAAVKVAQEKIKGYGKNGSVVQAKAALSGNVNSSIESPIDYSRTQIKTMPLSADSIKLDAQYFSYEENKEAAQNTVASIKSYVAATTSFLGESRSVEAANSAQEQVSAQVQNHSLAGTLVITAGCTHKNALLLNPCVLDVDKAIRVWNMVHPDDLLKPDDRASLEEIAKAADTTAEKSLKILSGATYGSSFVGMVHVLRSESTQANQQMYAVAASLQAQMQTGGWFADKEGSFGVAPSFANDVKRMLSMQQISSHVSIVAMGAIPTIQSEEVKLGVKEFAKFDPHEMMDKLATLNNATSKAQESVPASAAAARTGKQMVQLRSEEIKSVMTGLAEIADSHNKMLNISSLMAAFEDYVNKALEGNLGVPINYYVMPITKSQLAQLWVSKYYPSYLQIGDDGQKANGQ